MRRFHILIIFIYTVKSFQLHRILHLFFESGELTRKINPMNVEMDLREDILQRQSFERLKMGDVLGSFCEAVVEHPSDDVLDVTS